MNKFGRFLGRISAETCLNMDYFSSKSPKIAKRWRLAHRPLYLRRLGTSPPERRSG